MTEPVTLKTTTLPEGFTARPATLDDAEAVAALFDRTNAAKGIRSTADPKALRVDWQEPKYDQAASSLIVENAAGDVVAYASLWDNAEPPVKPWLSWTVDDDQYETGLAEYVLNWLESKAQRTIERCPEPLKISMATNSYATYEKRIAVLEAAGYTHRRNFYRMLIEMDHAPQATPVPEGIRIRSMRYPEEIPAVAKVVEDAFRDHWGFYETPLEENIKFWEHYLGNDDKFDPALYLLAEDVETGELTGFVLCRIEQHGRPEAAYVEELGVRREYRRRGLALALLTRAFADLWQHGRENVALYVDADSLTGATRLYEKAGMHADEINQNWQKVLRDGEDVTTTRVD